MSVASCTSRAARFLTGCPVVVRAVVGVDEASKRLPHPRIFKDRMPRGHTVLPFRTEDVPGAPSLERMRPKCQEEFSQQSAPRIQLFFYFVRFLDRRYFHIV